MPASGVRQVAPREPGQIGPERFPLVLFVPDVGPLEERHDQALRKEEDGLWGPNLRFHFTPRLCGVQTLHFVQHPAEHIEDAVDDLARAEPAKHDIGAGIDSRLPAA